MAVIEVVSAIASKSGATLYLKSGESVELSTTDYRTKDILGEITPALSRREVVEIDLDKYDRFQKVEEKTGGFLRFVIKKAKDFLGLNPETGGQKGQRAIGDNETLVAVVNGKTEIPGVQALEKYVNRAIEQDDCAGLTKFLERLGSVVEDRGHSVQELLSFMKGAELPITDDGCIIGYKTLCLTSDEGVYVDPHSKTVRQKLGSRVSMPMEDVDDDRRILCSTGLHVASLSYLRFYLRDVICLVKVCPEDVIAVPHYGQSKMRVMAYHIVHVMTPEEFSKVGAQKSFTEIESGAAKLADIIKGDHIGITQEVIIGEVKENPISDYDKEIEVKETGDTEFLGGGDNGLAEALTVDTSPENRESVIDPKEINAEMRRVKAEQERAQFQENGVATTKAVDPANKAKKKKDRTAAQRNRDKALKAVLGGMSLRAAAKKYGVCAKALSKAKKASEQ